MQNDNNYKSGQGDTNDGRETLIHLRDRVFDGDPNAVAVALGRPESQISDIIEGHEEADEDLVMKIHALTEERSAEA